MKLFFPSTFEVPLHSLTQLLSNYRDIKWIKWLAVLLRRFIYPDDLPGLKSSFKRTLAGQPEPYEFRILDKNGKILHVHTSSRLIQEDGKAVGLTGVMVEITDLKKTEQALLEAEAKYHTLIEQIPAAVYTDAIDELSSTVYISPQIEKLSGYTPEEWIADPALWGNIIHPEDRERVLSRTSKDQPDR